jgi:hypothetical protein
VEKYACINIIKINPKSFDQFYYYYYYLINHINIFNIFKYIYIIDLKTNLWTNVWGDILFKNTQHHNRQRREDDIK